MAAAIEKQLGQSATLIRGSGGIFVISVDGVPVSQKRNGVFPEPDAVVAAVRAAQP